MGGYKSCRPVKHVRPTKASILFPRFSQAGDLGSVPLHLKPLYVGTTDAVAGALLILSLHPQLKDATLAIALALNGAVPVSFPPPSRILFTRRLTTH